MSWVLVYILSISTGGGIQRYEYPMESQAVCLASVKEAKINVPDGGDSESTVSIFCAQGKSK